MIGMFIKFEKQSEKLSSYIYNFQTDMAEKGAFEISKDGVIVNTAVSKDFSEKDNNKLAFIIKEKIYKSGFPSKAIWAIG